MSFTPLFNQDNISSLSYKTWKIDFDNKRLVGYIDGKDSLLQHIYFILNIQKYESPIYSYNIGLEIENLFKNNSLNISNELFSIIKNALISDYRINDIIDFCCDYQSDYISVSFTIVSIYGNLPIKNVFKEVS